MNRGDRVRLIHTTDPLSTLVPGVSQGVIRLIDHLGTAHVDWDNGERLGMILGQDFIESVE